jgi:hypothetical protein
MVCGQSEQFSNFFYRGFFMKAFSLPLFTDGLPMLLMFPARQSLITTLATFVDIPIAHSGPLSGCEQAILANWLTILFPSIPLCPGTHTS